MVSRSRRLTGATFLASAPFDPPYWRGPIRSCLNNTPLSTGSIMFLKLGI